MSLFIGHSKAIQSPNQSCPPKPHLYGHSCHDVSCQLAAVVPGQLAHTNITRLCQLVVHNYGKIVTNDRVHPFGHLDTLQLCKVKVEVCERHCQFKVCLLVL